jgi:hypothetical protein
VLFIDFALFNAVEIRRDAPGIWRPASFASNETDVISDNGTVRYHDGICWRLPTNSSDLFALDRCTTQHTQIVIAVADPYGATSLAQQLPGSDPLFRERPKFEFLLLREWHRSPRMGAVNIYRLSMALKCEVCTLSGNADGQAESVQLLFSYSVA